MERLHFLTAGAPIKSEPKNYKGAFEYLSKAGLQGLELEFVHGVRISDKSKNIVKEAVLQKNMIMTAHAPFYINLNSAEPQKITNSIKYITDTIVAAAEVGAYSITYHGAYYMGKTAEETYKSVYQANKEIAEFLEANDIQIWVRPETTGKATQWGNLEEVVRLSNDFDFVLPCIDFSHLHARSGGGLNKYDDFAQILDYIGLNLGEKALKNFHAHIAGIEYTAKGERKHLMLEESDMNYKDLLKAFVNFDVKGVVVCESPVMEDDAILLKNYYESIL